MKVKNISKIEQSLVGIGKVGADEVVTVPDDFHNANFEKVKTNTIKGKED